MEVPEKKIVINEEVDRKLTEFEETVNNKIMPIKASADFVVQALMSPLTDETKERIVNELYDDMKKRIDGDGV